MKEKAVIVGAGTYGQAYAEYLKGTYELIGFIDDDVNLHNTSIQNLEVLGDVEYLLENIATTVHVFVPIGNTEIKAYILNKVRLRGFQTPNFIHPTANIHPSATIGNQAVYILQGSIIMPLTIIENDVIISSGTIITHHAHIQSGVFISFGVNIGASLTIKERAYLGIGCTIMTGIKKVGRDSIIGAGAVIIRDVPDGVTVVGNPGRIIE